MSLFCQKEFTTEDDVWVLLSDTHISEDRNKKRKSDQLVLFEVNPFEQFKNIRSDIISQLEKNLMV
jgi:hypothetical protein